MRLSEALTILKTRPSAEGEPFLAFLGCGFTPLHLRTFFGARLRMLFPHRNIELRTGLYGDLAGSLESAAADRVDCCAVFLEWSDIDARLGLRGLGGWRLTDFNELLGSARARLAHIEQSLQTIGAHSPVVVSLPALPIPPIQATAPLSKAGAIDLELRESLFSMALRLQQGSIQILSPQLLDQRSAPGERYDAKSDVMNGFPYSLAHADIAAEMAAQLVQPRAPKKGLITDLDNTLWKGILGEIGAGAISWDLDRKSHMHACYQELLRSLARTGVLIGIASKNDPARVDEAFAREDLILAKDHAFPFEAHWNPKSESVTRILKTWNIGPDSVVFVDDSAAELAEVQAAHPEVECLLYPADPRGVYELLLGLRDRFAKETVTEEDGLRLASIQSMSRFQAESRSQNNTEAFLEQSEARVAISLQKTPWDPRVLELINKTNQFNLNGRRYTEAELRSLLDQPDAVLMKASYQDKFGSLGAVVAILGCKHGDRLRIHSWVMSCRAFSRRIEYQCLKQLFRIFSVNRIELDYVETDRNQPLQDFLSRSTGTPASPEVSISSALFEEKSPRLYHYVEETVNA